MDLPCLRCRPLAACHCHYPGETQDPIDRSGGPWTAAFPLSAGGRLSRFTFSGPARHSLALWPASSLSCLKQPFDIGGSRPFVVSRTTPTASGWNDPVAGVGFAPTGHTTPITAHAEPRQQPGSIVWPLIHLSVCNRPLTRLGS